MTTLEREAVVPTATRPLDRHDTRWRRRQRERWQKRLIVAAEVVLILVVWQVATDVLELVSRIFLPSPTAIVGGLGKLIASGDLMHHGLYSAQNFAIGFTLAAGTGVALGIVIGSSYPIGRLVGPLAWAIYATPYIAIRPMTTVWFGFGAEPIIFMVFIGALLPILLNTMGGVGTVDKTLVRAAQVFGASRIDIYWRIVLPAIVPFIVTGLRFGVISGFIGLLIGEMVGSPRGLGAVLTITTSRFRTDEAFAAIIVLVSTSVVTVQALSFIERRFLAWRPGSST